MDKQKLLIQMLTALLFAVLLGCDSSGTAKLEANKEIVRRFNNAANNAEFNLLNDLVTADFVRHSQATANVQVRSRDEFIQLQKEFLKTFPDQQVTIEKMVAEGDHVAIYATYSGTQEGPMPPFPASGKKAESKFLALFRLQEGKIAELWVEWDNLAFLKQLGHFPPPEMSGK